VRLWDLEKGQQLRVFTGHSDSVHEGAVSPDRLTFSLDGKRSSHSRTR
jgi:hypothetical protein